MAEDRYLKDNILTAPELAPKRHYETDGYVSYTSSVPQPTPEVNQLLEILDDIDKTYDMCQILPDRIQSILQDILDVLSKDTQAQIIERVEEMFKPSNDVVPDEEVSDDNTLTVTTETEYKFNMDEDIFSSDPNITIDLKADNILELSQQSYTRDSNDLKRYYNGKIQQMTHRYFQVMSSIADDCDMPDFTYLTRDFESGAVSVSNSDSQHLKDYITKSQIIRKEKEDSLNKTHTADRTLILTRSWLAAEKQRERYLEEEYKTPDSLSAAYNNDLLLKSRTVANNNYKTALYNNYKYLNSSVTISGDILDMQIDEAKAKSQLSKEGVNIFASTIAQQKAAYEAAYNDALNTSKANASAEANEIINNINSQNSGTSSGGSSAIPSNLTNQDMMNGAKTASSLTGIAADYIYRQWYHESAGFTSRLAKENYNFGGLTQSQPNGEENKQPDGGGYYCKYSSIDEYAKAYAEKYINKYSGKENVKSLYDFCVFLKNNGYYGDSLDNYYSALNSISG